MRALWVALFASAILFAGLGKSPLWDRDETEYAQAALEMQQNGEWLIPTLEGRPFLEKPILLYWATRLSYKAFGVLTCLAAVFLGGSLYGTRAGFWAGMSLASMFLFAGGFRLLLTDPLFVFFSTMAFAFYARQALLPAYLSIGLAVLAKGPIGFFPAAVFALYEWSRGKFPFKHAAWGLGSAALAAPWFLYSFSHARAETSTFFLYDNLARLFQSFEGHDGPAFYYVIVLALGVLPWTFLLASALKKNWLLRSARKEPLSGADLLLALWALSIFILFSMSATKLPHYMFPVLPALACLVGKYVSEDPQREKNAWKICGGTLIFFLALIHFVLPAVDRYRVMKPIGVALKENAPADAKVYGYFVSEPSLFFYGGRLFPLIEEGTLDDLLSQKGPVFVITKESRFHDVPASVPHKTLARADGFSENGGKMTLRLLSNERP
ncbi:MAG: hypothetical protein A3A86_07255 [Elusimicrobia bacterium RIFCSPLOWO2_01_FULL_60_11]|nr:MAG: hypothetical protein A3A86_07255 [Elusimicrobia bacterium RIFCSPLOWO2_01_FULL_60_11]